MPTVVDTQESVENWSATSEADGVAAGSLKGSLEVAPKQAFLGWLGLQSTPMHPRAVAASLNLSENTIVRCLAQHVCLPAVLHDDPVRLSHTQKW